MWFVWLALLIDVPVAGVLTPFGWAFFLGLATLVMAIQLIGGMRWNSIGQ